MFTKAESAQPYIYSIFTPAGNCWFPACAGMTKKSSSTGQFEDCCELVPQQRQLSSASS
jgi:hypothetical protein